MNSEQEKQYHQALKLIGEEKWLAGAAILEDLINDVPSDEVTKALVWALYRAKQYTRAFVYFIEQPAIFTLERDEADLAVQLLLQNQSYISARLFIAELPANWQHDLLPVIQAREQSDRQKYQTTIQTLLRSFYHLGDCPLSEQQERLSDAQQLPLAEYLTGAQFLLRDPFAHQLIKASLVDTMRQIGVDQQVVIRWIDGKEYPLVPAKLSAIDDLERVHELRAKLTGRLGDHNPSELQLANQELQMQLMLLYPLIEQKVDDADEWVQCLISRIRGQQVEGDSATARLQEQLTEIIDDLGEKP